MTWKPCVPPPRPPARGAPSRPAPCSAPQFFKENPVAEATMALAQTVEGIRTRAAWLARDGEAMRAWLASRQ